MLADTNKLNRIQKQIQSDLSPKFTEMKTGVRTSRFGRPQKEAQQDINSIPTEVAKFVSKHSPKRLKPKETNLEDCHNDSSKKPSAQDVQNIPLEDKENFEDSEASGNHETVKAKVSELEEETPKSSIEEEIPKLSVEESEVRKEMEVEKNEPSNEQASEINKDVLMGEDEEMALKSPCEDGSGKQDFSDTDSALGSASSCHDVKNNNGEFVAGQVLWGSFSKLSWFPCMAYPIEGDEGNVISGE